MEKLVVDIEGKMYFSTELYFTQLTRQILSNLILKYEIEETKSARYAYDGNYKINLLVPCNLYYDFLNEYNKLRYNKKKQDLINQRQKKRIRQRAKHIRYYSRRRKTYKALTVILILLSSLALAFYATK